MKKEKRPSRLQKLLKEKKCVLIAICILLVIGILSPFVINGVVVGSARRYFMEPEQTEQVNADCVIALGAMFGARIRSATCWRTACSARSTFTDAAARKKS